MKAFYKHMLTVVILVVFCVLAIGSEDSQRPPLNASVRTIGTQVEVTNDGDSKWTSVKLVINDDYILEKDEMAPGVYTFDISDFTKSNGERFNLFSTKILTFDVRCSQGDFWGSFK